ncbi:MAG: AI-2E family transporter [Aquificae bacterium]|nr:AI-2E family transporter [Aquificota bacterium]
MSKSEVVENIFFFLLLSFSLFLGYLLFEPFLKVIIASIILAVVFFPVHSFFLRKIKRPIIASFISTFIVMFFVIFPSIFMIVFFTQKLIDIYPSVIDAVSKLEHLDESIKNIPIIDTAYQKIKQTIESYGIEIDIAQTLKAVSMFVLNFFIEKGKTFFINFTLLIIGILFMVLTLFFLFKDGTALYKKVYALIPLRDSEKNFLFAKSYRAIQGVVLGMVFTAIAQGIIAFIGYSIAGVQMSIFWAFLTFLFAFLPVGGAALVWIPIAIYVFFVKGIGWGIFLTLWGTFLVSTIDNIIKPIVIGDRTNIHPLVLAFAILGGLNLFGFLGLFLAPIILVLIDNMLNMFKTKYIS